MHSCPSAQNTGPTCTFPTVETGGTVIIHFKDTYSTQEKQPKFVSAKATSLAAQHLMPLSMPLVTFPDVRFKDHRWLP